MVTLKLVDREAGMECDFCDDPPSQVDNRLAKLPSRKGPVYFCQNCIVTLAAGVSISLSRAVQLMGADESTLH